MYLLPKSILQIIQHFINKCCKNEKIINPKSRESYPKDGRPAKRIGFVYLQWRGQESKKRQKDKGVNDLQHGKEVITCFDYQ